MTAPGSRFVAADLAPPRPVQLETSPPLALRVRRIEARVLGAGHEVELDALVDWGSWQRIAREELFGVTPQSRHGSMQPTLPGEDVHLDLRLSPALVERYFAASEARLEDRFRAFAEHLLTPGADTPLNYPDAWVYASVMQAVEPGSDIRAGFKNRAFV